MMLQVAGFETLAVSVAWLPGDAGDVTETSFVVADADTGTANATAARRKIRPRRTLPP